MVKRKLKTAKSAQLDRLMVSTTYLQLRGIAQRTSASRWSF